MGHGCWHSPHKGDLVSQRSTELKCLAAEIGQKEEKWLDIPTRGTWFLSSTELKCMAAEIGQKEENGACWYSPHNGDLVSQRSTELKCLAAEIGQKEENGHGCWYSPHKGDLVSQRSTS